MSTSPFSSFSSSSPDDRLSKFQSRHAKYAALKLDDTEAHSASAQRDNDLDAMYVGLTEGEIRFIERLNAPANQAPGASFNQGGFMPDAAQMIRQNARELVDVDLFLVSYAIHPYLGDCLVMISVANDVDFDDLVTLFLQFALQNPRKSLKKPFPGYGEPITYFHHYRHAPALLEQELDGHVVSTGLDIGLVVNRMLNYSLLHYYAGKLTIPGASSTD